MSLEMNNVVNVMDARLIDCPKSPALDRQLD